jgi:hypothetical protein
MPFDRRRHRTPGSLLDRLSHTSAWFHLRSSSSQIPGASLLGEARWIAFPHDPRVLQHIDPIGMR